MFFKIWARNRKSIILSTILENHWLFCEHETWASRTLNMVFYGYDFEEWKVQCVTILRHSPQYYILSLLVEYCSKMILDPWNSQSYLNKNNIDLQKLEKTNSAHTHYSLTLFFLSLLSGNLDLSFILSPFEFRLPLFSLIEKLHFLDKGTVIFNNRIALSQRHWRFIAMIGLLKHLLMQKHNVKFALIHYMICFQCRMFHLCLC